VKVNKYYIQRQGYVGNCLLWWRKGGHGYTCNLDEAEIFSGDSESLAQITKDTQKFTAWDKEYIDSCAHRHVDSECINIEFKNKDLTKLDFNDNIP
jgi:hypothetical protein